MENSFKDEDNENVIKFLNIVALKAEFQLKTPDIIEFFKLLKYMQTELLPKIDSHILEVKRIVDPPKKNSGSGDKK